MRHSLRNTTALVVVLGGLAAPGAHAGTGYSVAGGASSGSGGSGLTVPQQNLLATIPAVTTTAQGAVQTQGGNVSATKVTPDGTAVAQVLSTVMAQVIAQATAAATQVNLLAEANRATAAEGQNASAVTAEANRAKAAEILLAPQTSVTAETNRASAAEGVNAGAITTETNRATTVEATKAPTSGLTAETSRAQSAEGANASATSTETNRASAAEVSLGNATSTETARASAAEALAAPLMNAHLTGSPTVPVPSASDSSGAPAPTSWVQSYVTQHGSSATNVASGTDISQTKIVRPDGTNTTPTAVAGQAQTAWQPGAVVDTATVDQAGTAVAKSIAQKALIFNVLDILPQAGPTTDYTSVVNTAMAAGETLRMPYTGTEYFISGQIVMGAYSTIQMDPGAAFNVQTAGSWLNVPSNAPGAHLVNVLFDGSSYYTNGSGTGNCSGPDFSWDGGGTTYLDAFYLSTGCDRVRINRASFTWAKNTGIELTGANNAKITLNVFGHNGAFDMYAISGDRLLFDGNSDVVGSGSEFFAMTYPVTYAKIVNNDAEFAGDNCYSLSGNHAQVANNRAYKCKFHGYANYGDFNELVGNSSRDAGQNNNQTTGATAAPTITTRYNPSGAGLNSNTNNGQYYGIDTVGAFGGYGAAAKVEDNTIDDDQASLTQGGINIQKGYSNWATGTVYSGTYYYVAAAGGVYQAKITGASSATSSTAPSGTGNGPGTVATTETPATGVTISWYYISSIPLGTSEPSGGLYANNHVLRWGGGQNAIYDQTQNKNNFVGTLPSQATGFATLDKNGLMGSPISLPQTSNGLAAATISTGNCGTELLDVGSAADTYTLGALPVNCSITLEQTSAYPNTVLAASGTALALPNGALPITAFPGAYLHIFVRSATVVEVYGDLKRAEIDTSGGAPISLNGTAITVPATTSLLRFNQSSAVTSQTINLSTTGVTDGQALQVDNYGAAVNALTLNPSVAQWTNGSTLASGSAFRLRWSTAAAAWIREE